MLQTIKYSFLRLIRSRDEMFWILLFPIILGILFKIGFSDINKSEAFKAIPVAIVAENQENLSVFKKVINSMDEMMDSKYVSANEASSLLKDKKIDGILTVADKIKLTVSANMKNSSINQNILNSFVKQYNASQNAFTEIALNHPDKMEAAISKMNNKASYNKKVILTDRENADTFSQYFYNLLAMACLYTAMAGIRISIHNQGNLSLLGARRCISPMHKLKSIIGELSAFTVFNFICNLIAFVFIVVVLKVDLTMHLPLEMLTLFIATLTGISLGFFIGSFGTGSESVKESSCIGIIMAFCFTSGLMVSNMSIIIDRFCPFFNKINPAALIADSFYSLSVYNTFERYSKNMLTLCTLIIIFIFGGFLLTRRKKYASL